MPAGNKPLYEVMMTQFTDIYIHISDIYMHIYMHHQAYVSQLVTGVIRADLLLAAK